MSKSTPSSVATLKSLSQPANDADHDDDSIVPAGSNVLPPEASADEKDVHWLFNWAEGEMGAAPSVSIHQQSLARVGGTAGPTRDYEPGEAERAAARRNSRVRSILLMLTPTQVSVLARWSAAPSRIPGAIFGAFGRLSAVTGLTAGYREIGGGEALQEACDLVAAKVKHDKVQSIRRHLAKVKVEVIHRQAAVLLEEAWAAYAKARETYDLQHQPRVRRDRLGEALALLGGQLAEGLSATRAQGAR